MTNYYSSSGKMSGVIAYESGNDFIIVQFQNGDVYTYNYTITGKDSVEMMKALAAASRGLSTYISQNDPPYADKA